jgi:hypothetical protein
MISSSLGKGSVGSSERAEGMTAWIATSVIVYRANYL